MTILAYKRADTITLGLRVVAGDPAIITAITARMRKQRGNAGAIFVTTFVPATGVEPARWLLTVTPEQTEALPAGLYNADAYLEHGSNGVSTETIRIMLAEPVTAA